MKNLFISNSCVSNYRYSSCLANCLAFCSYCRFRIMQSHLMLLFMFLLIFCFGKAYCDGLKFQADNHTIVNYTTKCTKNNEVCATFPSDMGASYAMGGLKNYFANRTFPVSIDLVFNVDDMKYGKDFELIKIYAAGEASTSNIVGRLTQIYTGGCDNMPASTQKCSITGIYTGTETNGNVNYMHFMFKNKINDEILDLPIRVQNDYYTNQNVPIINLFNTKYDINNEPWFIGDKDNNIKISLINNGDGILHKKDSTPLIAINMATTHQETVKKLDNYNILCSDGDQMLYPQHICSFNTKALEIDNSKTNLGGMIFTYNNGLSGKVIYGAWFILGGGYLKNLIAYTTASKQNTVEISKLIQPSKLQNIKFYFVNYPHIYLGSNIEYDKQYNAYVASYAFGEYDGVSIDNMLSGIKLDYQKTCFDSESSTCTLFATLDPNLIDKIKDKPLFGLLIAEYDVDSQHIRQTLGAMYMTN